MKIAIFGAAGAIGRLAVKHALQRGYEVNAYARNTSGLSSTDDQLHIIQGEVNDLESMVVTIKGCEAVVWCVGIPMTNYKGMPTLEGCKVLLKAMERCEVKRLVCWATPSAKFEKDQWSMITTLPGIGAGIFYRQQKKEVIEIANLIKKSDTNWTIVRYLGLKDNVYKGFVRVSFGDTRVSMFTGREDIAKFMIDQVENVKYLHSMPIIGY